MASFRKRIIFAVIALCLICGSQAGKADPIFKLPESLQVIEEEAFRGDLSLKEIWIPDSVRIIENRAFANSGLKKVYLPETLTFIEPDAFEGIDELSVTVDPGSYAEQYCLDHGFAYRLDGQIPYFIKDGVITGYDPEATGRLSIPGTIGGQTITGIGDHVFEGQTELTAITLPASVTHIGSGAFAGSGLTYIRLGAEVTGIGDGAFDRMPNGFYVVVEAGSAAESWCRDNGVAYRTMGAYPETEHPYYIGYNKSWTYICPFEAEYIRITFDPQTEIYEGLDYIQITDSQGNQTQYMGSTLAGNDVYLPGNRFTIEIVAEYVEHQWAELYGFSIQSITGITAEEYEAPFFYIDNGIITGYSNGSGISDLIIPSMVDGQQVTGIGLNAFREHRELNSITLSEGIRSIDRYAFADCTGMTGITIPESVTEIGEGAFAYCSELTSIRLPERISHIPEAMFRSCSSLREITLPESLISIGNDVFFGCHGLTEIALPAGMTSIGNSAFRGCSGLTEIVLPAGVTSIGNRVFSSCGSLREITLPEGLTSIGNYAFSGCDGLTRITLPQGITSIGNDVFSRCRGLTRIMLPQGITSIGNSAFWGCNGLTEITLPEELTSIGNDAFNGCIGLTDITLPEGVTSIGNDAFNGCSGLEKITLPESLIRIGNSAFSGCDELTAIQIPANVTQIGNSAFAGCGKLKAIQVSENNETYASIDGVLFNKAKTDIIICPSGLEGIFHVPGTMTTIGNYAFDGCAGLTGIQIPESVESIGRYAFRNCRGLTEIEIPDSVTTIGVYAFQGCASLTSAVLPNGLTQIETRLFDGCRGLSECAIPGSVTRIGDYAFYCCSSLTGIILPNSLESIGYGAFSGCSRLRSIRIPQGVRRIESYILSECSGLTSVTLSAGITVIGSGAFYGCSSLQRITIPNGVTEIENSAFKGCRALSDIRLPGSLRTIGESVFFGCESLESITIPEGVRDIGIFCFGDCINLSRIIIPESLTWNPRDNSPFASDYGSDSQYRPMVYGGSYAETFALFTDCPYAGTVNAEDCILSISQGSNGEKSVFFTSFGESGYELYGADSIDGIYLPIAWADYEGFEGCEVIDWHAGSNKFYRILSSNSWTTPFRAEDYGTKFRIEEKNGTIRILGIYSRDTITEIEIPKTIDGTTVSGIAEDAFASFTQMDRISLPYELREYLSILIRPNPETRILIRDDGHIVIAGDVIKSIARSSSGPVYSIFFQEFEAGKETYTLLASERIDGEYRDVTRSGATLFDCRVIVYGTEDAEEKYYRIQGENLWTSPFRMNDYGMTFRTESVEGGLRIIGVYSGNTITEIRIPQNIDGILVTGIAQNAFASYSNLDLIVLPDGLMSWKDQMNIPSGTSVISATERALFDQIYRTDEEWAPCSTNAGKHYLKSYKMHFESTTYPALNRVRTISISEGDAEKKDHEYDIEGSAFTAGPDHYTFLHYAGSTCARCSVCGKERRGTENDFYKAEVRSLHSFGEDGRCTECGHEEDEADRYYQVVIPTILSGGNPVNAVAEIIRNRMHDGGLSYYMADVVIGKLNGTDDATMRDNFLLSFFLYDIDTANETGESKYLHTNRTLIMTSQEYYSPVEVFFHEAGHAIQYNTIEKQSKNDNSVNVSQPSATLSPNYGLEYGIQNTLISAGREYIRNEIRNYSIDNVDYINALRHNIKKDLGTGDDSPLGRLLDNIFSDKNLTRNLEELILEIMVTGQTYYQQVDDFTLSDEELEQMVNLYVNSQIKESNELYWAPEALERNLHLKCLYSCVNKSITEKLCERGHSNADMLPEVISGITNNKVTGLDTHRNGYHYQNGVLKITLMRECWGEYVSGQLMASGKDDENLRNFKGACGKMQQLSEAIKAYYLRYFSGE